jgi:hypothetical protein
MTPGTQAIPAFIDNRYRSNHKQACWDLSKLWLRLKKLAWGVSHSSKERAFKWALSMGKRSSIPRTALKGWQNAVPGLAGKPPVCWAYIGVFAEECR